MADISRLLGRLLARSYRRGRKRYLVAIVAPILALLLTVGMQGLVQGLAQAPFFPWFTLAVVVAAAYGGTRPGLVAVAACVLLSSVIVVPPRFSLRVADPGHLWRLLLFTAAAVVITMVIGAIADLQRKLDIERERLHITLLGIGDAVIATDETGRITFLNPTAESVTGWKKDEVLARPLEEVFQIINEKTRVRGDNPVRKVLQLGTIVGLANHTVLIRKDGEEIVIDDSAAPIRDQAGATVGVVLVFRDVTSRRNTELILARNEKLASVGRLAATIAHEINNPLESVTNLLYLVSRQPELLEATRGYVALAQRELARAAHVSKQTLSFARGGDSREVVDVRLLTDGVLELYAPKIQQKHIALQKRYDDCGPIEASSSEVRQVIANLLANALDALAPGGGLQVRLRETQAASQRMIRVTIADNGHGIETRNLSKIFEPFFTTKDHVGTGLGLWVSKQILERHGGFIRVRSRVGKGTVFAAYWPMQVKLAPAVEGGLRTA